MFQVLQSLNPHLSAIYEIYQAESRADDEPSIPQNSTRANHHLAVTPIHVESPSSGNAYTC
jgi:hypothetical protein